jgi:hypothetical protein
VLGVSSSKGDILVHNKDGEHRDSRISGVHLGSSRVVGATRAKGLGSGEPVATQGSSSEVVEEQETGVSNDFKKQTPIPINVPI